MCPYRNHCCRDNVWQGARTVALWKLRNYSNMVIMLSGYYLDLIVRNQTFLDHGRVRETSNKERASCESTEWMWEKNRLETSVQLAFSYQDILPIYRFGTQFIQNTQRKISNILRNVTLMYTRIAPIYLGDVHIKGKAIPGQGLRVPGGWGSHISRQSAHDGGKVVSPLPPRKFSRHSFLLEIESISAHSAVGRIISIINSNDPIGNRNCDFPGCSAVPQPTAQPRVPEHKLISRYSVNWTEFRFINEKVSYNFRSSCKKNGKGKAVTLHAMKDIYRGVEV